MDLKWVLFSNGMLGAVVLAGVGGLHVYWACGGRLGKSAVVPERDGRPLFSPSPAGTLLVAGLFLGGAACLLARLRVLGGSSPVAAGWCTWAMAAVFLLRAVGDFRYLGLFKRVRGSRFAFWDTRLYAPLCLVLSVSCVSAGFYPVP
jgi:hypothetical protein